MNRVVLSSTTSETYSFFLLIAAKIWRSRIGYEPIILLIGHQSEWSDGRSKVVLDHLDMFSLKYRFIERLAGVSDANMSMSIRQHAAALEEVALDDLVLVGDVDLLPIDRDFYHQHDLGKGPVAIYHSSMYDNTYWPAYGPSMAASTWCEVMGLTRGDILGSLERTFKEGEVYGLITAQKSNYLDSRLWTFDEEYASKKLRESRFAKDLILFPSNNDRRLCRNSWPTTVYASSFIDCHCPRPGWSSENWGKIRPVLSQILPEDLSWVDWYANQYFQASPAGYKTREDRALHSQWDSDVLGLRVGLLDLKDRPLVSAAVIEENRSKFDVVFVKANGFQTPQNVVALDHSYDMELEEPLPSSEFSVVKFDKANPSHVEISKDAFTESRFLRDPRIATKTSGIYLRWLCGQSAVYGLERLADEAFMVLVVDQDGAGRISLLAVQQQSRGSGLGTALVRGVMDVRRDLKPWRVRVSSRNWRALRFYESLGFKVKSAQTAYHIWMKGEG